MCRKENFFCEAEKNSLNGIENKINSFIGNSISLWLVLTLDLLAIVIDAAGNFSKHFYGYHLQKNKNTKS